MSDFRNLYQYREPHSGTWRPLGWHPVAKGFRWVNAMGVLAISSIHLIDEKPQYHLSYSQGGERITAGWMEALLRQWQIEDFEEDNHVPNGKVRNFWKPFDPEAKQCRCKDEEPPHEETGGYIWRDTGPKRY